MLKKVILLLGIFGAVVALGDIAPSSVPPNIVNKFYKTTKSAAEVEWDKVGNMYQVEYKVAGLKKSILYSAAAAVIQTEEELPAAQLPAKINKVLKAKFTQYQLANDISKISNSSVFYKIELKDPATQVELELVLDDNGKVLVQYYDT